MIWLVVIAGVIVVFFRVRHTMGAIKKYGRKEKENKF
ncbi:MAG: hypothetical protein K0S12_2333 [Bacteroidetes bacterium]|jgi:uncharacterized membrane protein YecN with MAPEG domain|nr:hypothetical protein [Bacteroidota bacterium]